MFINEIRACKPSTRAKTSEDVEAVPRCLLSERLLGKLVWEQTVVSEVLISNKDFIH